MTTQSAGRRELPNTRRWLSSRYCRNAASPRRKEGNILTEEEQWAKLKLVVDVANEVWGR